MHLNPARVYHSTSPLPQSNTPSINLFASLGFKETRRIAAFKEVHMEVHIDELGGLLGTTGALDSDLKYGRYD